MNPEIKTRLLENRWQRFDVVFWSLLVLLFFSSFVDFFLFEKKWAQFLILKSITAVVFYVVQVFFRKKTDNPTLPLHIILFSFNLLCITLISQIFSDLNAFYFNMLTIIFIMVNSIVIWDVNNSVLQYLGTVFVIVICLYVFDIKDVPFYFGSSGFQFLFIGLISTYFPRARRITLVNSIKEELQTKTTLSRLQKELDLKDAQINKLTSELFNLGTKNQYLMDDFATNAQVIQKISAKLNKLKSTNLSASAKNEIDDLKQFGIDYNEKNNLISVTSKMDSSHLDFSEVSKIIEITPVYRSVVANYITKFNEKKLQLFEQIDLDNSAIKGDALALSVVIKNMLRFALHYSSINDTIDVQLYKTEKRIFFKISNRLHGISPEEMEQFFLDPKSIPQNTEANNQKHIIELNLAKELTEGMGGFFDYASSKNKGFELSLQFTIL